MNKALLYIISIIFLTFNGHAQNYIGLHKDEIMQLMRENKRNFKLNTSSVNNAYNYLKYEDNISEQTMLFFLSKEDTCKYLRLMSDYSNLNDVLDNLNSKYTKSGKDKWTYVDKGKNYIVKLDEGDWYFTVTIKPEN
jgi:hypothetical protein